MDPEMDFIADAAADVYSDWRNQWASLLSLENADGAAMAYLDNRNKYYNTLEWYYSKKSSPASPFLTGGVLHLSEFAELLPLLPFPSFACAR